MSDLPTFITGMCCAPIHFGPPEPKPIDDDVAPFFCSLGYRVSSDWSRRTMTCWWEISDGDGLIAQIDKGVPISHIVEDLSAWHRGEKAPDRAPDYEVNTDDRDDPRFRKLLECVALGPIQGALPL
jgi:hypothetical protein